MILIVCYDAIFYNIGSPRGSRIFSVGLVG